MFCLRICIRQRSGDRAKAAGSEFLRACFFPARCAATDYASARTSLVRRPRSGFSFFTRSRSRLRHEQCDNRTPKRDHCETAANTRRRRTAAERCTRSHRSVLHMRTHAHWCLRSGNLSARARARQRRRRCFCCSSYVVFFFLVYAGFLLILDIWIGFKRHVVERDRLSTQSTIIGLGL